jgi:hypothetical protein
MLTVSPWASMNGLEVLPHSFQKSENWERVWVCPEEAMEEGDCIVFAGINYT